MARMLRNRAHPESSVMHAQFDKELVSLCALHGAIKALGKRDDEEEEEDAWGEEELQKKEHISVVLDGPYGGLKATYNLSVEEMQQLHLFYYREVESYRNEWDAFVPQFVSSLSHEERRVRDITRNDQGVWDFTPVTFEWLRLKWQEWVPRQPSDPSLIGIRAMWQGVGVRYKKVVIEGVTFCERDWIWCAPMMSLMKTVSMSISHPCQRLQRVCLNLVYPWGHVGWQDQGNFHALTL